MITRKTMRIIGTALIVIGLTVFGISYYQGLIGQEKYSNFGCAVDARPQQCIITNNQMIGGFVGMIFAFFTAFFGASLVVPPLLMKLIKRIKAKLIR